MIFVTGAAGFLGSRVVALLRGKGEPLRCLSRSRHADAEGIEWRRADLCRPLPAGLLEGCSCVIHAAAAISAPPRRLIQCNTRATAGLVEAARAAGVRRFVFISSLDAAGGATAYGRSKREAEAPVMDSGLEWMVIRPAVMFGAQDTKNFALLDRLVAALPVIPLPADGAFLWEPVSVDDVAEAVCAAAREGRYAGRLVTVTGPRRVSFDGIIGQFERRHGVRRMKLRVGPRAMRALAACIGAVRGKDAADSLLARFTDKLWDGDGERIAMRTDLADVFPERRTPEGER